MVKAHIFALPGCPYCEKGRRLLATHRIEYTQSFPSLTERSALAREYDYGKLPIIVLTFDNHRRRAILGSDALEIYLAQTRL